MEKIKIVIADDHPLFLSGVRLALQSDNNIEINGEASNGKDALDLIRKIKPDVAVLDINMPFLSGLEIVQELRKENQDVKVVLLTMFDDEDILNAAMDLDVKAYILKESASLDIVNAVYAASMDQNYLSPGLILKLEQNKKKPEKNLLVLSALSDKEKNVLALIADSKTTKEIGELLYLSPKTIENYRYRISEKLKLSGSYSLLKFALEHKDLLKKT